MNDTIGISSLDSEWSKDAARVEHIMRRIRKSHWKLQAEHPPSLDRPVIYWEEANYKGSSIMVPLVILRTKPCKTFVLGGCTMCNFMLEAAHVKTDVTRSNLLEQVNIALSSLGDISKLPYILFTTAGSFLSNFELDPETSISHSHPAGAGRIKMHFD